jgi:hypothetical protein
MFDITWGPIMFEQRTSFKFSKGYLGIVGVKKPRDKQEVAGNQVPNLQKS